MQDISERLAESLRAVLRGIDELPDSPSSSDASPADFAPDTGPARAALAEYDASRLRQVADPLTVAYIAIGAESEFGAGREYPGGQLEFISDAIRYALALDRVADAFGPDQPAVFAYEVAEEFGQQFGSLVDGTLTPLSTLALEIAVARFEAAGYTTPDGTTVAEFVRKHWRVR